MYMCMCVYIYIYTHGQIDFPQANPGTQHPKCIQAASHVTKQQPNYASNFHEGAYFDVAMCMTHFHALHIISLWSPVV